MPDTQLPYPGKQDQYDDQDMYKCVHCGFCLQSCPTYLITGLETESPRGRIALMKAVNENRIDISPATIHHWDMCIQCRSCEVVCPSGVPYGKLIENTMSKVRSHRNLSIPSRIIRWLLVKHLLTHLGLLALLFNFLKVYQKTGLEKFVNKTRILKIISPKLASLADTAPRIQSRAFNTSDRVIKTSRKRNSRVALLSGCVMPLVHGAQMDSVTDVLSFNGCEVAIPKDQGCCGAINSHVGDLDTARFLARRNIDAFLPTKTEAIVTASAGCGIRMKEYPELLKNDMTYGPKAIQFSSLVKDIHEFLVELPLITPAGEIQQIVTYQDSCHLSAAQGISDAPRQILKSIPGLNLLEMSGSTICCGSGGTYSISQPEASIQVLDSKMAKVIETGANVIATSNPGCLIQLEYGVRRINGDQNVKYVTDLLAESYRLGNK